MSAVGYALQLLTLIPELIAAGKDVTVLIQEGQTALRNMQRENRDPSSAEWDDLNKLIAKLRAELHS